MNETLTTKQAAELLGVHPVTLRVWRQKSDFVGYDGAEVMEDCQGLRWFSEHGRKVVYYADSVQRLKRILQRRKGK